MRMQAIVPEALIETVQARVQGLHQPIEIVAVTKDGEAEADLSQAEALFRTDLSSAGYDRVLEAAPRLRWIHTASAGVEELLTEIIRSRNIVLTNSAGVHAVPIAEWVMHVLLMIVKRARHMLAAQQARRWDTSGTFDELTDKTLTILGIGGLGRAIAKRASAFDMRIWGVNRSGQPVELVERLVSDEHWRDLLPETDFLVITVPLTKKTYHMIGAHELVLLRPSAWLINVARGAVIDEAALVAALQAGTIAGAALDTFEQEPLPPESPLWELPNVIISPHHSGSSPRTTERVVELFIDNLQRFVRGEELRNVVDLAEGY
jgi:phosphoglycerate dehydrogenase-like enzyme